jgi:hypothetical protein
MLRRLEAVRQRREALRLARQRPADRNMVGILTSVSATAFCPDGGRDVECASRVARGSVAIIRECCGGTPHPYRVEHAGTIVNTPSAEEVRELNAALTAG